MLQFAPSEAAPELWIPVTDQCLAFQTFEPLVSEDELDEVIRKILQPIEPSIAGIDQGVVVLDGGVYPDVDPRDYVNLEEIPDPHTGDLLRTEAGRSAIRDFHVRSLKAGARAITTNTWNISEHIQGEKAEAMTIDAVNLAFEAIAEAGLSQNEVTVFISMRSIGDCYTMEGLPPDTREGNAEIKRVMKANIQARKKALGDRKGILLFETVTNTRELEIARDIVEEELEFGATACPSDDGQTLRSGESLAKFVDVMDGAAVYGFNCNEGNLIRKILGRCVAVRKILSALRSSLQHPPLIVYPQGYMPPKTNRDPHNHHVSMQTFEEVRAENIREITNCLELGARVLGGCCGVTVEETEDNTQIVKDWKRSKKPALVG